MKKLLLPLGFLLAFNVQAQKVVRTERATDHSTHITGSNFEGVVFTGDDFSLFAVDSSEVKKIKIFTPTKAELNSVEKIIYSQIKGIDKDHHYRNGLDIFNNWKKYRHQYIFYSDQKGKMFVFINCFSVEDNDQWSKMTSSIGEKLKFPRWCDELIAAFDGGDTYWRVRIDLQTKKIIEFNINGSPV